MSQLNILHMFGDWRDEGKVAFGVIGSFQASLHKAALGVATWIIHKLLANVRYRTFPRIHGEETGAWLKIVSFD